MNKKVALIIALIVILLVGAGLVLWGAWPTEEKLKAQIVDAKYLWTDQFYSESVAEGKCSIEGENFYFWNLATGQEIICKPIPVDSQRSIQTSVVDLYGIYVARLNVTIEPVYGTGLTEQIILEYDGTSVTVTLPQLVINPKIDNNPEESNFLHIDREINPFLEILVDQVLIASVQKKLPALSGGLADIALILAQNFLQNIPVDDQDGYITALKALVGDTDALSELLSSNADDQLLRQLQNDAEKRNLEMLCGTRYREQITSEIVESLEQYLNALYWDIFTIKVNEPTFVNCP